MEFSYQWQTICCFLISFSLDVPIRTKRMVVDKHMEVSRFSEELKLLEKEMMGFVKYYKNSVLPSLIQQQQNLQDLLTSMSVINFLDVAIIENNCCPCRPLERINREIKIDSW